MKQRYYLPFLSGAMSLSMIGFSWLSAILSLFHYAITCFNDQSGYYKAIFQVFVIVSLFSIVLSFIKRIYYKFQVATFILIGINFLIFLLNLDFLALLMFTNANINYDNVYSWYALLYIIVMLVTIIVSSAYYVYCYKIKKSGSLVTEVKPRKRKFSFIKLWDYLWSGVDSSISINRSYSKFIWCTIRTTIFSSLSRSYC